MFLRPFPFRINLKENKWDSFSLSREQQKKSWLTVKHFLLQTLIKLSLFLSTVFTLNHFVPFTSFAMKKLDKRNERKGIFFWCKKDGSVFLINFFYCFFLSFSHRNSYKKHIFGCFIGTFNWLFWFKIKVCYCSNVQLNFVNIYIIVRKYFFSSSLLYLIGLS